MIWPMMTRLKSFRNNVWYFVDMETKKNALNKYVSVETK